MLITVQDPDGNPANTTWLNRLHDPDDGLIVVHTPPGCHPRALAAEILQAIRRPAPYRHLQTGDGRGTPQEWAKAWLRAARPRCDLIVHGAWRLLPSTVDWLTELGAHSTVNVWLITEPGHARTPAAVDSNPHRRHWSTFKTRPWTRPRDAADDTPTPAAARNHRSLPPFPHAYAAAEHLEPADRETLNDVQETYSSIRGEIHALLNDHSTRGSAPAYRDVLASVARVALITTECFALSGALRLLEHEVWIAGGLLVTDPDQIAEALTPRDPAATIIGREPWVLDGDALADPIAAAWAAINHRDHAPLFDTPISGDASIDGRRFVFSSGRTVIIPPADRWALRAALQFQHPDSRRPISLDLPSRAEIGTEAFDTAPEAELRLSARRRRARTTRAELAPIADRLEEAMAYEVYGVGLPADHGPGRRPSKLRTSSQLSDALSAVAAQATAQLFDSDRRRHVADHDPPMPTTEGVAGLLERQLAVRADGHAPVLVDWLYEALARGERDFRGPHYFRS